MAEQLATEQAVADPERARVADIERVLESVGIGVAVVDELRVGDYHGLGKSLPAV